MKLVPITLCIAALATFAGAFQGSTPASAAQTMSELSRTAERELAASIQSLNDLRASIDAEKVPISEEITRLEEILTDLRRDHESVTRAEAQSNLDVAASKQRAKGFQDELDYVSSLLDEYVRTFETKVHVSELQTLSETIDAAKDAPTNNALSPQERFARQLTLVDASLKRAVELVGGMRYPGVGVDLQGVVAQGQFALIGPIVLFRAANGVAGLVVPQAGSDKPLIRPLEGSLQAGLATLVETGDGVLPFDPSMGGALKAIVQKTNLWYIFEKGGPIMWPLLIASILALGTVLERLVFLANERRKRDHAVQERFFGAVARGAIDEALSIAKDTRDFVVRSLGYALEHRDTSLSNALSYAQAQELKRFKRGIPVLDTVITLAPLLGLLGTVTGMMGSFSLIGGDLGAPGAITGGIAEALIATAFGLGIAIVSLLPFNFLNARMEDATHELESAGSQLERLVAPAVEREVDIPRHGGNASGAAQAHAHAPARERAPSVAAGRE